MLARDNAALTVNCSGDAVKPLHFFITMGVAFCELRRYSRIEGSRSCLDKRTRWPGWHTLAIVRCSRLITMR